MFQTTEGVLNSKSFTISLEPKTGITQASIVKLLNGQNQENITNLIIQSEDSNSLVAPVFNTFKFSSLVSLKIESSLKELAGEVFVELANLKHLDLSRNQIESIDQNAFKKMRELKVLNLAYNKLKSFESGTFLDLNHLRLLDLSFNQLSDIEPKLFVYMFHLRELNLNGNQFGAVSPDIFQFIKGKK